MLDSHLTRYFCGPPSPPLKATALRQRLDSARAAINSVSSLLGTSAFSEESLQKAAAEVDAYRLRMSELSVSRWKMSWENLEDKGRTL